MFKARLLIEKTIVRHNWKNSESDIIYLLVFTFILVDFLSQFYAVDKAGPDRKMMENKFDLFAPASRNPDKRSAVLTTKTRKNSGFLYDPMKPATPFISFHNIYMFVYFIKTSQIKSSHIIFILLDEIFPIISINKKKWTWT